jgi:DNA repair protein RadD
VPCTVFAPKKYQRELAATPLAAYQKRAPGRRTIVFCGSVHHARETAEAFSRAGYPAECVEGKMKREHRRAALRRFTEGRTRILTNVMCLTEGTDLPPTECVIVARGCTAESAWIQMIGRGMRTSPETGKTRMLLLDLLGQVHVHGLIEEPRTYHLDGQAIRKLEGLPPLVQCKFCLSWLRPSAQCPDCGAISPPPPEPKLSPAELREVKRERQNAIPRKGDDWEFFANLVRQQRARGKAHTAPFLYIKAKGHPPRWRVEHVPENSQEAS